MMRKVFLVDDDSGVRRSLTRVLREEGYDVEAYESAEAFLTRADLDSGGCLLLDVSMPGLDGLGLQRRLAEAGLTTPIVFLTGHGDIPMSVRAIKSGAVDFLTKPVASATLLRAVRDAIEQDEAVRRVGGKVAELRRRFEQLTSREREVLAALAEGRLNKQIASDLGIVEQTVKFHRARIMERMQARTAAELMHMVAELGIGAGGSPRRAPVGGAASVR